MKRIIVPSSSIANVTVPVSTKATVLIGKWLKGINVDKAIVMLEKVILKKLAVPFVKYNDGVPHKRGMAAGRYPVNSAKAVIKTLNLVKSNAKQKGLNVDKLIIHEFIPNMAYSQNSRSKFKRGRLTHLKIGVVEEK